MAQLCTNFEQSLWMWNAEFKSFTSDALINKKGEVVNENTIKEGEHVFWAWSLGRLLDMLPTRFMFGGHKYFLRILKTESVKCTYTLEYRPSVLTDEVKYLISVTSDDLLTAAFTILKFLIDEQYIGVDVLNIKWALDLQANKKEIWRGE